MQTSLSPRHVGGQSARDSVRRAAVAAERAALGGVREPPTYSENTCSSKNKENKMDLKFHSRPWKVRLKLFAAFR
jgi:hypothetical protein